jgi:hypothetical protein
LIGRSLGRNPSCPYLVQQLLQIGQSCDWSIICRRFAAGLSH